MSLTQLRDIVGGELTGDAHFGAVSTDTRTLREGELFVALKGPNFNGNRFVADAAGRGACAALVGERVEGDLPTLQVEDTRIALGRLGAHNRLRSRARVLALTGSQGKTTVKEMCASILSRCGEVLYTHGNLNNDYGVPLTLLRLESRHRYAVIELGANACGEIAYTTRLTNPDIALINNVAATHVEGFGSVEGVARGKAEIWQGLSSGGIAIINLDDARIVESFPAPNGVRRVTISAAGDPEAEYRIGNLRQRGLDGSIFTLHTPRGDAELSLSLPGRHNVANALAAAAMAMEAGAEPEQVRQGLADMVAVRGRLQVRRGRAGAVILDDSYNASPSSFRAAIDLLADLPGRRIVAAGDMGELGEEAEDAHRELGAYAAAKGIDEFHGTGRLSALAVRAFGEAGVHSESWKELSDALLPKLEPGLSVLVKGSRSAGMERVVKQLTEQED